MTQSRGTFRGLPPFLPFSRAASALASLVTCPPFRPSATAAGFLRDTAWPREVGAQFSVIHLCKAAVVAYQLRQLVKGVAIDLTARAFGFGPQCFQPGGVLGVLASDVVHAGIKPNRLGFVNRVKLACLEVV